MDTNKKNLIEDLGELLKKHNVCEVSKMEYYENDRGEFVKVTLENGHFRTADVTADSLVAMLRDTLSQAVR